MKNNISLLNLDSCGTCRAILKDLLDNIYTVRLINVDLKEVSRKVSTCGAERTYPGVRYILTFEVNGYDYNMIHEIDYYPGMPFKNGNGVYSTEWNPPLILFNTLRNAAGVETPIISDLVSELIDNKIKFDIEIKTKNGYKNIQVPRHV